MTPLDTLFHNLDTWRHFPAYQLERRADIFFSVYLREVLQEVTGVALESRLIPELPLRRALVVPGATDHKSVKVDYAAVACDRSRVLLVELKTDDASRRGTQDEYLRAAERLGFGPIVAGIRDIILHTPAAYQQKYFHLAHALAELGFLRLPEELPRLMFAKRRAGLTALLEAIEALPTPARVEVLYIQPTASASSASRIIDFDRFAAIVGRHDDPISQRFAASLRAWRVPAGRTPPG